MGIAGIYRRWKNPNGGELFTFSMLTVNADTHPLMKRMHKPGEEKRMVVILEPKEYLAWLTLPRCSMLPLFFQAVAGRVAVAEARAAGARCKGGQGTAAAGRVVLSVEVVSGAHRPYPRAHRSEFRRLP